MSKRASSFRIGRVHGYLRGKIWYLCYHENGRRHRPRIGPDLTAARQMAAQVNGQLALGAPAVLSFRPIAIPELREHWLQHHEQVLRSSVQTIARYRTASQHLLRFLQARPVRHASQFHVTDAEAFVHYLRKVEVAPNGHAHSSKRLLMDKGLLYVLECCRALFNYGAKRRHLPPYAENPFSALEINRIPIEESRPIELFTAEQEQAFLDACDDWQLPIFLTLMLTGLRVGELTHLFLPADLDLEGAILRIRNKRQLGWQTKTRNERDIPMLPELVEVLRAHLGSRRYGPVFLRRSLLKHGVEMAAYPNNAIGVHLKEAIQIREAEAGLPLTRSERCRVATKLWRAFGAIKSDRIRVEFMRLTKVIGQPHCTAPKLLRHQFATALQEGRVDPLIRNELMGHVATGERKAGHGLAMTAVYTHTQPVIRRQQLADAFESRSSLVAARRWLAKHSRGDGINVRGAN